MTNLKARKYKKNQDLKYIREDGSEYLSPR